METVLKKAVRTGMKVTIIYQARSGFISQRTIRVFSLKNNRIVAYCYVKNEIRTFHIKSILAIERTEQRMGVYMGYQQVAPITSK